MKHVEPRKGDIRASYADVLKAREELGYFPRFSLLQGLVETITWFYRWDEDEATRNPASLELKQEAPA